MWKEEESCLWEAYTGVAMTTLHNSKPGKVRSLLMNSAVQQ